MACKNPRHRESTETITNAPCRILSSLLSGSTRSVRRHWRIVPRDLGTMTMHHIAVCLGYAPHNPNLAHPPTCTSLVPLLNCAPRSATGSRSGRRDRHTASSSAQDPGASKASSNKRPKTDVSAPATPSAMIPSYLRARFGDKGSALRDQPSSRRRQLMGEGDEPAAATASASASSPVKPKKLAMSKAKPMGTVRAKPKAKGGSNKSSGGGGGGVAKVADDAEDAESDMTLSREQRRSEMPFTHLLYTAAPPFFLHVDLAPPPAAFVLCVLSAPCARSF